MGQFFKLRTRTISDISPNDLNNPKISTYSTPLTPSKDPQHNIQELEAIIGPKKNVQNTNEFYDLQKYIFGEQNDSFSNYDIQSLQEDNDFYYRNYVKKK